MNLLRALIVLFITIPLLELYLLIRIGGLIGAVPTIMVCIFTAIAGATLMRYQGWRTMDTLQVKLAHGEFPAQDLLEGVILLCGGIMLLTPGFITDLLGFICLIPACRAALARWFGRMLARHSSRYTVQKPVTLEGEYWREDQLSRDRPDNGN